MTWRVLITCPQLQATIGLYRRMLSDRDIEIELPEVVQQLSESQLLEMIDGYDGVIAGDDQFTAKVLEKGQRLKVVARWGVGMDGVDLAAAERLGIQVVNTPNAFSDEVADLVMGYIIMLARQLHSLDQSVRSGGWDKIRGMSLRGKTLGIIGLGNIGRSVAQRAAAAGMGLLGCDVVPVSDHFLRDTGLCRVEQDDLLRSSDFISLNCNLTADNRHMLGRREFDLMKQGVHIVNTSRGPLIDEAALVQALSDGKVAGAALDVFEEEPLSPASPLRQFDRCIFGTHNGSNTQEAVIRVNEMAIANLLEGLGIQAVDNSEST